MIRKVKEPGTTPVTLDELKVHLKIDHRHEDEYLSQLIKVATSHVEHDVGRSLISQVFSVRYSSKGSGSGDIVTIDLPFPPLMDVQEVNVVYPNEFKKPMKRFIVDRGRMRPCVEVSSVHGDIEVVYKAGYGDYPHELPADLRQAVMIVAGDMYEKRGDFRGELSSFLNSLLSPYRLIAMG